MLSIGYTKKKCNLYRDKEMFSIQLIKALPRGTQVSILREGEEWYKVASSMHGQGYVNIDSVKLV